MCLQSKLDLPAVVCVQTSKPTFLSSFKQCVFCRPTIHTDLLRFNLFKLSRQNVAEKAKTKESSALEILSLRLARRFRLIATGVTCYRLHFLKLGIILWEEEWPDLSTGWSPNASVTACEQLI